MTVKELIEKLKEMPQDAKVWMEYEPHDDSFGIDRVDTVFKDNQGEVVLKELTK